MKFSVAFSVLAGVSVLAFAGCTDGQPGNARPVTSSATAQPSRSTGTAGSEGIFGAMKACDLLDQALQGQGYGPGEVSNTASLNGCQALKPGLTVRLDLDDKQSIEELRGDPAQMHTGDVNGRPARQLKRPSSPGAGCYVAMEVGPGARALVLAGFGTNPSVDEACAEAEKLATAVEPKLPKA